MNHGRTNPELQGQCKSRKKQIAALSTVVETTRKRLKRLQSRKTRSDVAKKNLLVHLALLKNREKKPPIKNPSEASEEDAEEEGRWREKCEGLRRRLRDQGKQIEDLYRQINFLKENEEEHLQLSEDYRKLDRFVKLMTENNQKVKTFW